MEEEQFVIERLAKGAIINHRSFMLRDESDTEYKCLTSVSCYELSVFTLEQIRDKKGDMKQAFAKVEREQIQPEYPLALDYILHNNNENNYHEQLRRNGLRVRLKNAIMQTWSKYKAENARPSMADITKKIIKENQQKNDGGKSAFA